MRRKIGKDIRKIRKKQPGKLSMEDFGKLLTPPASKGLVSNWENDYNYPNKSRLKQIAEIGNVTIDELLYSNPLSQYTTEELEAELEKRKSPYGNTD